ncbi:SEL1-like repeat protein [Pelagibius sp. CAU 1746]|uniref:SEL1-like repeat protein n=1 Tax=Pelagibius sp. CAU 1746 TaxID=3140370 RepID=UPI00325AC274
MIMRRPISATVLTVMLSVPLWAGLDLPRAEAAEGHDTGAKAGDAQAAGALSGASGAGNGDAGASPWEHPLWANATTMMRIYLCDHARRPPSWCGEPQELPANAELPSMQGPPLIEEDARWLTFLEGAEPTNLSQEDVATIRLRAIRRRDPQAMEILGFLYAEGVSVERDYAEAYRWYGLAYLAGERQVRANMDVVWQQLQRHDLEAALALARQFDALQAGEIPESLVMGPAPGADAGTAAR